MDTLRAVLSPENNGEKPSNKVKNIATRKRRNNGVEYRNSREQKVD
jgi:hypothetical protein